MVTPVLVIHGGAGSKAPTKEQRRIYYASLKRILDDVYPHLLRGESAVKCAVLAVELLENDPLYNAGKGSKIQSDGKIRMSASLMDGHKRRFSGCVNVEGVKNPIRLAEALQNKEDRVLGGRGARAFAKEIGLEFASPYTKKAREQFRARLSGKTGTVGAVVLDKKGHLASATSTGGRVFEYPHRVSDSPTTAGNYANRSCAVSATGIGEHIVDFAVASTICTLVEAGQPLSECARRLIRKARREDAGFGFIALDRSGHIETLTATECLIWASMSRDGARMF